MGQRLPAFPDLPAHRMTVVLDEAEYVVRFTWRARLSSWFMDLFDLEGNPLALGRRLSTGWGPMLNIVVEGGPETFLIVVGPAVYVQEDLGGQVAVIEWTGDELAEFATTVDSGVVVVL